MKRWWWWLGQPWCFQLPLDCWLHCFGFKQIVPTKEKFLSEFSGLHDLDLLSLCALKFLASEALAHSSKLTELSWSLISCYLWTTLIHWEAKPVALEYSWNLSKTFSPIVKVSSIFKLFTCDENVFLRKNNLIRFY